MAAGGTPPDAETAPYTTTTDRAGAPPTEPDSIQAVQFLIPAIQHAGTFCAVITPSSQDHHSSRSCTACAEFVDLDTMYNFDAFRFVGTDDFDGVFHHIGKRRATGCGS
jgi:hypothetical protein